MEAARAFPPSPVFSDSDSLAGIDDLDAFLDSKGELSRWPTPPSRRWLEEDLEVPSEESDYDSEDGVDDLDIATVFARQLGLDGAQAWDDILLIEDLLIRANLPIEVLALSFNILSKLLKQQTPDTSSSPSSPLLKDLPLDLLILSTLSLASIYTNDHPPSSTHWATEVAITPTSRAQIDSTSLEIMSALDWRIHECSDGAALVSALRLFERRDLRPSLRDASEEEEFEEPCLKPQPLSLKIAAGGDGDATRWVNGQLTPGSLASFEAVEGKGAFLPLL